MKQHYNRLIYEQQNMIGHDSIKSSQFGVSVYILIAGDFPFFSSISTFLVYTDI